MIGFRVDANEKIATGHLVRCISIATELISRNIPCIFFMAESKEISRLEAANIPYVILHTDWQNMESEYSVLLPLLKKYSLQWLIVDSYQITTSYLSKLNEQLPVLYIDDMFQTIYPVSAILCYGLWSDNTEYIEKYSKTKTKLLAGMSYTPLRKEFQNLCKSNFREKSILITTGGTDPYHITKNLLTTCLTSNEDSKYNYLKSFSFDIIIGSMNEDEAYLKRLAMNYPQIHLHKNIDNMSYYMCNNLLAVSAGGTTLLELCACGTPTICFSFADNQIPGTQKMKQHNIMLYAGDARFEPVIPNILLALEMYITNEKLRQSYASRMKQLIDGNGVKRIADFLTKR